MCAALAAPVKRVRVVSGVLVVLVLLFIHAAVVVQQL
jgi:hypothetical protein